MMALRSYNMLGEYLHNIYQVVMKIISEILYNKVVTFPKACMRSLIL